MTIEEKGALFENAIKNCKNVLILTHQYPDYDAVGSCLALSFFFKERDINSDVFIKDHLGEMYHYLPEVKSIVNSAPIHINYDTIFVLDCSSLDRVNETPELKEFWPGTRMINIDHHPDNTLFGDINIVESISSVGELLCTLFDAIGAPCTEDMAICLYSAIVFDTGQFCHSNVTPNTLKVASELVQCGARPELINQGMNQNKKMSDFLFMKSAIETLTVDEETKLAFTVLPRVYTAVNVKIVDFIRQLKDIDVFVVFQKISDNKVKINLRSESDFNVSQFAKKYGGGGHIKASGLLMKGDINKIQEDIIESLKNDIKLTTPKG